MFHTRSTTTLSLFFFAPTSTPSIYTLSLHDALPISSTWTDRVGRDRTPSIPGHELAGVVTALGYGTTGLSIGQRVFGLTDWYRDGTLAEYVAVEARNLTPLPGDVDFTVGAALVMPGLTAWQG